MTAKLCLRCDWSGDTAADVCPTCGAGLFTRGRAKVDAANDRQAPVPARHEGRTERSWKGVLAVALIVAFAIGAVLFVQRHTPSAATAASMSTGRHGFLLSSSRQGDGVRMWVWDLDANTAVPGPLLDGVPEELVSGYEVQGGWVGITTRTGGGRRAASVLRHLGPGDRPVTVATGDLIAWAPGSSSVSIERRRPVGRCSRIAISTWFVSIRRLVDRFDGVRCGEPVAFARDRNLPYLTIERDGVPTTLRVDHRLLSVSADGDLLVQRPGGGLELSSPSTIGTRPVPIGGHGEALDPFRVLGWSADGSQAFVLGTYGGAQGIFQVSVGPEPPPRSPRLLLATNAVDIQATPTADGDVYVSTDGAISLIHGDDVTSVAPPPGVPTPLGSILWVATLPYFSTEG
jgi:hypothetical protein